MKTLIKLINLIFLLKEIKKIIKIKINKNSPLVKINKPEIIEKRNIFPSLFSCINNIKNFKNNNDKIICKFIEEI